MHVIVALGIVAGALTILIQRHRRKMLILRHKHQMELLQETKSVVEVLMLEPDRARETHRQLGEALKALPSTEG